MRREILLEGLFGNVCPINPTSAERLYRGWNRQEPCELIAKEGAAAARSAEPYWAVLSDLHDISLVSVSNGFEKDFLWEKRPAVHIKHWKQPCCLVIQVAPKESDWQPL